MSKALDDLLEEADSLFNNDMRLRTFKSKPIYEKALEKAIRDDSKLEIEYIKARLAVLAEDWKNALKHFNKAIKLDPFFVKGYNNKGNVLRELGRPDEAMEAYSKALEIDPEDYGSWLSKGHIFSNKRKFREALECYEKCLQINPKCDITWNSMGIVFRHMGNYKKALESFDKALEINKEYDYAWNNKGNIFFSIRRYEEALSCFNKALEINPKSDLACANKGKVLNKLGRNEEAIKCIDKCLKINPKSRVLRFRKNSILMNTDKFDEAQEDRGRLYSEEKEDIKKSELPEDEKKGKILEIDVQDEIIKELKDDYKKILEAKNENEKKLASSLDPRNKPIQDNFLIVLRRWNSYTPTIPTGTDSNLGGGYFIRWCGKGIVIDPGFDFLDNFFANGFVIDDINAVIITHAHIDHCVDFESLLTLIFEYNEKNDKKKSIDVFMNLGTIKKLLGWIPLDENGDNAKIKHIYPLEKEVTYNPEGYNLKITAKDAIHDEILSTTYSVGVLLELYGIGEYTKRNPFKIGYTSDTGHSDYIERQYRGVDIIITHLGSIEEDDFNPSIKNTEGNHLMLKGVISTIYKSKADLAIVSEFGEELGEHRNTIVKALNKVFLSKDMASCLTGDIGLKVRIPDLDVKCYYCSRRRKKDVYVKLDNILENIDPKNKSKKSIIHFCKDCERVYEQFNEE